MKRIVCLLAIAVGMINSVSAAYETISNGAFENPLIWDCACVPSMSDDVVIRNTVTTAAAHNTKSLRITSGSSFTISVGDFVVENTIDIESGASLINNTNLYVKGDYVMDGVHSGNGRVYFSGNGLWSGTGATVTPKKFFQTGGVRTIPNGSDLSYRNSSLRLTGGAEVHNYGIIELGIVASPWTTIEKWKNFSNSTVIITWNFEYGVQIEAHHSDNTFEFTRMVGTQSIVHPMNGFYNLVLKGASTSLSDKMLRRNLVVHGELNLVDCTFDVLNSGIVYDIEVAGDWNNSSGRFNPRSGQVEFSGNGSIFSHTGLEGFYDMEFSGTTILASDVEVESEVFISNQVNADGYDMYVLGDWVCVGDYIGSEGAVIFEGTSTSSVAGVTVFDDVRIDKSGGAQVSADGSMRIFETLWMDNGVLTTNDNVYIASSLSRTGRLGEMGSASFSGDLIVERAMNFPQNGWHLIGSSVDNMTIADWNDDFITTGFTGADWPTWGFCNITRYDESLLGDKDLGIYNVVSTSDVIPQGEGVRAYIASGYNKLNVKGPAITGPFNWSLTYNPSGSAEDDGWNLVSNPYPSTIDWDDTSNLVRSGVKDAIYVWVSEYEQYSSYIAGVGTNGGTRYIPSSQAFWVQTEASGPTMSIVEAAKVDEDETFRNNEDISYFKIRMTTSNGRTDETAIRIDENASFEFDSDLDAYEWRSSNVENPSIGLITAEGKATSIYSFPEISDELMIPMSLYIGSSGSVSFTTEGLNGFVQAQNVRIFDSMNDEYHALRDGDATSLTLESGEYNGRFYIVINPRTSYDAVRSNLSVESNYKIWSDENSFFVQSLEDESGIIDIDIYDAIGKRVYSESSVNLNGLHRADLPETTGLLIIDIHNSETGERTSKRIVR